MGRVINKSEAEAIYFGGIAADQTLYGMAAVSRLLSGEENSANTLRALFGSANCAPGTAMGGRPYELFQRFGREHWPDLETLLNEHMLFPLYRAVAGPERYEAAISKAKQPGRSGCDVLEVGWHTLRRGPRKAGLRMCPLCVTEDSAIGPALWRLSHQIPWVTHCWRHGTPLVAQCAWCGAHLAHYSRPRMPRAACHDCKKALNFEAPRNDFETHVARFYLDVQLTRGPHIPYEARLAAYRARSIELDYCTEAQATRAFVSEQYSSVTRKVDSALFDRLSEPRDWHFKFGAMFHRGREQLSRHETLFLPWLFSTWSDVLAYSQRVPVTGEPAKRAGPASSGRRREPPDQLEARLLAAMECGFAPRAAAKECGMNGLFGKYLAHKIGHPLAAAVDQGVISRVIELAKSGMYTGEIAATLNLISMEASVIRRVYYREIGDADLIARRALRIQAAKDQLYKHVSDENMLTANQLRQAALSEYNFLKASDPGWIKDLLKSADISASQRRASKLTATDDELLALLRDLDERWLLNPPPYRKARSRIRRELGAAAWMLTDLNKLPKSKALLQSMVETARVANSRRVRASLLALPPSPTVREVSNYSGIDWEKVKAILDSAATE